MYIKYKIIKLERKTTSTGKNKIDADLQDADGAIVDKATIWDSFPNFATLAVGSEVMGQITVKQNGQYTNKTLNEEKTVGWGRGNGGAKTVNISKLMDKKAENIAEAQGRKNDSIAYFNSVNSAIALVTKYTDFALMTNDEMHKCLSAERDWFLSEWQKYEADPVKGKQPF